MFVDMRTAGLAPELLEELNSVRLMAPDKLVLSCRISPGDPTAEVRWYRTRFLYKIFMEVVSDEKYEIIRDGDTASLIIAVSQSSDSAIYRCEAVNKFGKVRTECRVVVLGTVRVAFCPHYDTICLMTQVQQWAKTAQTHHVTLRP